MKKLLSLSLTVVLLISAVIGAVLPTSAAEGVTNESFTDGVTWKISDGATMEGASWGSVTGSNGSVTVSHANLPYRSAFAKITGFTAGETYDFSFKIPTTGIEHVTIVLDDTAYFKNQILYGNNGQTRINSGNCSTFSSGTASKTFTATNDFIYIAVKFGAGVTSATFSDFSIKKVVKEVDASSFTDGATWKISDGATMDGMSGVSFKGSYGSVTVSHANLPYRSAFAKITGFTAGETYDFSFKIPTTGIEHVTIVLDDTANFKNQILYGNNGQTRINSGNCSTFSSGTASKTFTATNDFIYIAVKFGAGVTSATFSDFSIKKVVKEVDASSFTDGATWKISNGATTDGMSGVSFKGSNGSVTVSNANLPYRSAFAKITGFTAGETYDFSFKIPTTGIEHVTIVLDDTANFKNHILYGNNGQTRINSGNCSTFSSGTVSKTFTATNDFIYIAVKFGAGVTSATFSNFSISKQQSSASVGNAEGNAIVDGTWKAFNPHQNPDATVDTTAHTVTTTNTYRSIYTKFTAEANTHYKLSFNYFSTGTYSNGVTNVQIVTSRGSAPIYIPESGALDADKNSVCSNYQNDANIKKIVLEFVTGEGTDYYLTIQTGGFTTLTLSGFSLEKIATLSAKESGGSQVVLGKWTAKSSNISIASKDVATRTIKASNTNYHWVIGKITGLTIGQTYKLTFVDDLNASNSILALPADEDATSSKDYVIDANGAYQGKYYKNKNSYSTVIKNSETKLVTVVFTAVMENYHIFIHHQAATSASYSDITFEKFNDLNKVATSVSSNGLKFAFKISKDLQEKFAGLKVKEYGTIATIAKNLREEQLVYAAYETAGMAKVKKQIAYNKEENIDNIFSEDPNGDKTFTTLITGISSTNRELVFAVRPYVVLENNAIVYGSVETCSLAQAE